MMRALKHKNKGFSLIELSIVLIIIGLLVGGALAGKGLIEASEVKKLIQEIETYQTAFSLFKDQYDALPGDLIDATDVLPNGGSTDNGDGNLLIETTGSAPCETLLTWQHLELAGYLSVGNLPGTEASCSNIPSQTVPSSAAFTGAGFSAGNRTIASGTTNFNQNILDIGAYSAATKRTTDPILTTSQAFRIDTTIDDGKPLGGNVRNAVSSGSCVSSNEYDMSQKNLECMLTITINASKQNLK